MKKQNKRALPSYMRIPIVGPLGNGVVNIWKHPLVYLALSHFFLEAIVQVDTQFRPLLSSAQSAKSPLLKLQSKSKFV